MEQPCATHYLENYIELEGTATDSSKQIYFCCLLQISQLLSKIPDFFHKTWLEEYNQNLEFTDKPQTYKLMLSFRVSQSVE